MATNINDTDWLSVIILVYLHNPLIAVIWDQMMKLFEKILSGISGRIQKNMKQLRKVDYMVSPPRLPQDVSVGGDYTLQDALDAHQKWIDTEGKQGQRLSLEYMDMQNIDFRDSQLIGARMVGCDLRGSVFDNAVIEGSDFSDSNLRRTSFVGARCARSRFIDADMTRATLDEADLTDVNFRYATLDKSSLKFSNLERANFRFNIMTHADLSGSNLTDAKFGWVVMEGADLRGSNISKAVYNENDFHCAITEGPMEGQSNSAFYDILKEEQQKARESIRSSMMTSSEKDSNELDIPMSELSRE